MQFGAIFDWDGVIIDSSLYHEQSWHLLAREHDLNLTTELFLQSFGMKSDAAITQVFGWTRDLPTARRMADRKEELYRSIIREQGIVPLPGVVSLLNDLQDHGIPCAIGSSTPRENILETLRILRLGNLFRSIIAAEDVTVGKPDPRVFLLAAEKLDILPEHCVVFEDAHVGIAAARAARMKSVAVATTHPAATFGEADMVCKSLADIRYPVVASLFQ